MSATNAGESGNGMSVIIPTYNRGKLLCEALRRCAEVSRGLPVEFIVIDDGSRDDTPERLAGLEGVVPNLQWRSIPNGGPGQARNLGASLARKDIVLFFGDDIRPCNDDFFRVHLDAHEKFPKLGSAVLGKVIWPSGPNDNANFVMQHIQGRGGEQFGYYDFQPYTWLDYRFFYTCNVSVKRRLVDDWMTEGFSPAFVAAAYEDTEFAYRMQKRCGLAVFYTPGSVGEHWHEYSIETFVNRQLSAGMMLKVFLDLHPELAGAFDDRDVIQALASDRFREDTEMLAHVTAVFEGITSLAKLLSHTQRLGSQNWHNDLLTAVFRLAHSEGVLMAYATPSSNLTAGRLKALEKFQETILGSIHREVLGRQSLQSLFPKMLADAIHIPPQSTLRQKLGRVPGVRPIYRMMKSYLNAIRMR